MADAPRWRRFENLAAQIQRTISGPEIRVEQNVRLPGKRSGRLREIDILVTMKAAQFDVAIVIDCKDYRRKVNVKDVEAFLGLTDDVGANKGAMIAARGFTKSAERRAHDAGIDLYTLVDAESREWGTVTIPTLVEYARLEHFKFRIGGSFNTPIERVRDDIQALILYRADGSLIAPVWSLLVDRWNSGRIPAEPGTYPGLALSDEPTFVKVEGVLHQIDVRASATVSRTLYFGELPAARLQGLADVRDGSIITREVETADLSREMFMTWPQVGSRDEVSRMAFLTVSIRAGYDRATIPSERPS